MKKTITKVENIRKEISIPGDKSISHRSIMFGSLAKGDTRITNFLKGADCLSTIDCFRRMGIDIEEKSDEIIVHGKGLNGLSRAENGLDTGNSGTTTRLISGILAGQNFVTELNGDESIQTRPMKRIMTPLRLMGADIESIRGNDCAPLRITGGKSLKGIDYISPVASAQVKSAIILAGLYAEGQTSVVEPTLSRNHTELMLQQFGADIESLITPDKANLFESNKGTPATAIIRPGKNLYGQEVIVPGDISSAAYFIAEGLLVPGSEILIKNVGINPTRAGILKVAEAMGAKIEYLNKQIDKGEPVADLLVRPSELHGTVVEGEIIPTLIDEIPIICIMAACAAGTTIIKDAAELKVKESDRIAVMTENLLKMGCDITPTEDGMIINGGKPLTGASIDPHMDHRIAMSFAVAGLVAEGETTIENSQCVDISFPNFYEYLGL